MEAEYALVTGEVEMQDVREPEDIDDGTNAFIASALSRIASDALTRCRRLLSNPQKSIYAAFAFLPAASAQEPGYPDLTHHPPTYQNFRAAPIDQDSDDGQKALADVNNFMANSLDWTSFAGRAHAIRISGEAKYCIGNLSIALSGTGGAYQAGASGATTLLTLLPTAGALIGTPVTELWVLYKLMPLAGIVSMVLSLGGNLVPTDINDYERVAADFNYSGMIASRPDEPRPTRFEEIEDDADDDDLKTENKDAQEFANLVASRARDVSGIRKTGVITFGIILQLALLGCIMVACWFMQSGSIVVWWCTFWPWMYFWYGFVSLSSLIENLAGVPFTRQWTIRCSRAPSVEIADDAPWVIPEPPSSRQTSYNRHQPEIPRSGMKSPVSYPDDSNMTQILPLHQSDSSHTAGFELTAEPSRFAGFGLSRYSSIPEVHFNRGEILARLERGYNTHGRVVMDKNKPWSAANNAFYVIISVRGVSHPHAILRVFSKFLSIGIYTVGTAMFASSTLATILVAVVVASLVIVSGVFGRITAMWMVSELMKNKPIMHKVAKDRAEAECLIEAMLRKPKIAFEILEHVVINGRCVKRFGSWFRPSKFLGVLASPFDITELAMRPYSKV